MACPPPRNGLSWRVRPPAAAPCQRQEGQGRGQGGDLGRRGAVVGDGGGSRGGGRLGAEDQDVQGQVGRGAFRVRRRDQEGGGAGLRPVQVELRRAGAHRQGGLGGLVARAHAHLGVRDGQAVLDVQDEGVGGGDGQAVGGGARGRRVD